MRPTITCSGATLLTMMEENKWRIHHEAVDDNYAERKGSDKSYYVAIPNSRPSLGCIPTGKTDPTTRPSYPPCGKGTWLLRSYHTGTPDCSAGNIGGNNQYVCMAGPAVTEVVLERHGCIGQDRDLRWAVCEWTAPKPKDRTRTRWSVADTMRGCIL